MFKIKDKVEEMSKLAAEIRSKLDNKLVAESAELLAQYDKICKNPDYYLLKTDYYLLLKDYNSAIAILNEFNERIPFNKETDNKFSKIYVNKGEYGSFLKKSWQSVFKSLYAKVMRYLENNKKLENAIKRNIKLFNKLLLVNSIVNSPRMFPISNSNQSLLGKTINDETGREWLINNYRESAGIAYSITPKNIGDNILRTYWNTETIKGMKIKKEVSLEPYKQNETICLPICTINNNKSPIFEFDIDGKELKKEFKFIDKKFYHIRIENAKNIQIKSFGDFFIGTPRTMRHKSNLKKLVVSIFIDGLSSKHLQTEGLENLMPNTNKFFEDGFIGDNAYATAEWTLSSYPSIVTGLSVPNHMLYHSEYNNTIPKKAKLMAEYYSEKGYCTTSIESNPALSPSFGYYRGFDRIIYKHHSGLFDGAAVIGEVLETLQAFQETNNFISISFMDLHDPNTALFNLCENISTQTQIGLMDLLEIEKDTAKSVYHKHNHPRIAMYDKKIKKLDTYLGVIYEFITKYYATDDVTVVLTSDHGQSFLKQSEFLLNEYRTCVPFMIKDTNAPQMVSDEIIQNTDLLPTMLKLNDIQLTKNIDGLVPKSFGGNAEREFAYTETIYPNQTYKVALTTKTHIYHLETLNKVRTEGTIVWGDFTSKLINRETGTDESMLYPEKMSFFECEVFKHIKNNMVFRV